MLHMELTHTTNICFNHKSNFFLIRDILTGPQFVLCSDFSLGTNGY